MWVKVPSTEGLTPGTILWVTKRPTGSYEVLIVGRKEVLARKLDLWDLIKRRWRGRFKRWWFAIKRRVVAGYQKLRR